MESFRYSWNHGKDLAKIAHIVNSIYPLCKHPQNIESTSLHADGLEIFFEGDFLKIFVTPDDNGCNQIYWVNAGCRIIKRYLTNKKNVVKKMTLN